MWRLARDRWRGGWGRRGGGPRGDAPDIDFDRIIAQLVRHFHQPEEYWLTERTLQDWTDRYGRDLRDRPPAEFFAAAYFGYEAPGDGPEHEAREAALPALADL